MKDEEQRAATDEGRTTSILPPAIRNSAFSIHHFFSVHFSCICLANSASSFCRVDNRRISS